MPNKITKNTTIKEILEIEGGEEILIKHNVPCLFCPMASFEIAALEIRKVCQMYGIDLKNLLKELNTKGAGYEPESALETKKS